jgi:hypothetical protein
MSSCICCIFLQSKELIKIENEYLMPIRFQKNKNKKPSCIKISKAIIKKKVIKH